jgi:pilus assembly protein CpaB
MAGTGRQYALGVKIKMGKSRVIVLASAGICALLAAYLANGLIGAPQATPEAQIINTVKTDDVLVAAKDIGTGEKLGAGAVAWKSWPLDNILPNMITKTKKPDAEQFYAEARAGVTIYEGETILEKKVVIPGNAGFMSAILPKGMEAMSVKISASTAAGGFILPNDRVDVILVKHVQAPGASQLVTSETVISNVRVLAINQMLKQAEAKEGEPATVALKEAETATLELTHPQVEILAKVESEGELALALRSIAESDGKAMQEGPQLADKYKSSNKKGRSSETLFVRYGIETYSAGN